MARRLLTPCRMCNNIAMAYCKTVVSPVLKHWRYHSLALSLQLIYSVSPQSLSLTHSPCLLVQPLNSGQCNHTDTDIEHTRILHGRGQSMSKQWYCSIQTASNSAISGQGSRGNGNSWNNGSGGWTKKRVSQTKTLVWKIHDVSIYI